MSKPSCRLVFSHFQQECVEHLHYKRTCSHCIALTNKRGCRERSIPAGVRGAPEKLLFLLLPVAAGGALEHEKALSFSMASGRKLSKSDTLDYTNKQTTVVLM